MERKMRPSRDIPVPEGMDRRKLSVEEKLMGNITGEWPPIEEVNARTEEDISRLNLPGQGILAEEIKQVLANLTAREESLLKNRYGQSPSSE